MPEEKKRPKVEDFDVKRMSRIYFGRRILRIIWINSTSKEFIATIGGISWNGSRRWRKKKRKSRIWTKTICPGILYFEHNKELF